MSTILVIDDSKDSRELVSRVLSKEHKVHTAESWSQAFSTLTEGGVDLVLLDVQLPGFSGEDIAQMLLPKKDNESQGERPKIVFFSALDKEILHQKAKNIGAAGYIQKTYDSRELKRLVNNFLSEPSS